MLVENHVGKPGKQDILIWLNQQIQNAYNSDYSDEDIEEFITDLQAVALWNYIQVIKPDKDKNSRIIKKKRKIKKT